MCMTGVGCGLKGGKLCIHYAPWEMVIVVVVVAILMGNTLGLIGHLPVVYYYIGHSAGVV